MSHGSSSVHRLGGFLRRQQRTRRAVFSHVSFLLSGEWVDSSVSETSLSLGVGEEANTSGVCRLRGTQSQRWGFSTDVGLRCERSSCWAPDVPTDTDIPLTTDTQDTQVARSSVLPPSRDPGWRFGVTHQEPARSRELLFHVPVFGLGNDHLEEPPVRPTLLCDPAESLFRCCVGGGLQAFQTKGRAASAGPPWHCCFPEVSWKSGTAPAEIHPQSRLLPPTEPTPSSISGSQPVPQPEALPSCQVLQSSLSLWSVSRGFTKEQGQELLCPRKPCHGLPCWPTLPLLSSHLASFHSSHAHGPSGLRAFVHAASSSRNTPSRSGASDLNSHIASSGRLHGPSR